MRHARSMMALSGMALLIAVLGGNVLAQSDDDVMNATDSAMAGAVTVSGVWSRPAAVADGVAVAYMTIVNDGDADDALVLAASAAAAATELHQTSASDDGMMSMSPVDSIPVPAGGQTKLEPGGYHIMLAELSEPLAEGDSIEITLVFEGAGAIVVSSDVLAMDAEGPPDMDAMEPVEPVADLPTKFTVEALDNFFVPSTLEANANTEIKVTLLNYGFLPHNIAFYVEEGGALLAEGSLTSVIDPETEASTTFTTPGPGEYFILCVIHPEMTGTLIVR